jgi:plasmid maintenance system antidote protein VapI
MPERTKLDDWLFQHDDMTQTALAEKLGIHVSTVNRAVKGNDISPALWAAFADLFGVPEAREVLGPLQVGRGARETAAGQGQNSQEKAVK